MFVLILILQQITGIDWKMYNEKYQKTHITISIAYTMKYFNYYSRLIETLRFGY